MLKTKTEPENKTDSDKRERERERPGNLPLKEGKKWKILKTIFLLLKE